MNFNPREQVARLFIEIPRQPKEEGNAEKAAHHADLSQGQEIDDDYNATSYDRDIPYYVVGDRYE